MKKSQYLVVMLALSAMLTIGCKEKQTANIAPVKDTTEIAETDTTIYGLCGEGTTMHSLELITNEGDTLSFLIDDEDPDFDAVKGGLLAGDKLAVVRKYDADEPTVEKVINLTTLEGKWTSLDRNFEIVEGGEVLSTLQSESNPYTSWKILNGQLLMGRDTFDVLTLGADTLELENSKGIFVYIRK